MECVSRKHTVGYLIFKLTGGGISKAAAEARLPLVHEQIKSSPKEVGFSGKVKRAVFLLL